MKRQPTPTGCIEADEHEREFTALAELLHRTAVEMLASDGRVDVATGKEAALASIRARRCAAELATARYQRDHDLHLIDEARKLDGAPAVARARLVRHGR